MGNPVERMGFGCVALTRLPNQKAIRDLLELVHDLGVRHFDTAPVYGQGYSERLLGEFLRGKREDLTIATKFGLSPRRPPSLPPVLALALNAARRRFAPAKAPIQTPAPDAPAAAAPPRWVTRDLLEASFDNSRRALRTDYIDLLLLHEGLPSELDPRALDFLQKLRQDGKVRRIGLAARGERYLPLSAPDLAPWDVLQYEAGPAWRDHDPILTRFPQQQHIFHSCFTNLSSSGSADGPPGRILAQELARNPQGRVLFSSTHQDHVRDNIRAVTAGAADAIP